MSKAPITRVSGLSVTPSSTNKNNGLYAPQLTTTQITAIPAATLINGAILYNSTTNLYQGYQSGALVNFPTSPLAQGGNLVVQSSAADPAGGSSVAGEIYYNTGSTLFRVYQNAVWSSLYANITAATGVGLVPGNSPFSFPSGTSAAVEVAGNQVNGFIYYNTTTNLPRAYLNGAWTTLVASPLATTVTGVGLVAGSSPLVLPSGTAVAVEVAANQVNGFIYYNTTANTVRIYFNGGWSGLTVP